MAIMPLIISEVIAPFCTSFSYGSWLSSIVAASFCTLPLMSSPLSPSLCSDRCDAISCFVAESSSSRSSCREVDDSAPFVFTVDGCVDFGVLSSPSDLKSA